MTNGDKGIFPLKRDIIVIGASAGGREAIMELCRQLPKDFPAALFIVWHMPSSGTGTLHRMINKVSPLPAHEGVDGEPIEHGRIYVAPVDRHLIIEFGHVRITKGPKENRFRPAIDPLFRSAAFAYGPRVIGIVLSGALNDGTSGLWTIKDRGGMAIVQDPEDAAISGMPLNALENVDVDYTLPLAEMCDLLVRVVNEPLETEDIAPPSERLAIEVKIAKDELASEGEVWELGQVSEFTCPECHGSLWQMHEGNILRFRCRTGHAYTSEALLVDLSESVEAMQWATVRGIEESAALMEHMSKHLRSTGDTETANHFLEQANHARHRAELVRQTLLQEDTLRLETEGNGSAPV